MAKTQKPSKWDFEGYATRYGIKCGDGETIAHGAFKNMDGEYVALVDDHARGYESYLDAVIGNAFLEHRDDGVYAYITFNANYDRALRRKEQVEHGDIQKLSIKANMLKRLGGKIVGGIIRDLSIVSSGANPGAFIRQAQLVHGDGFTEDIEDEAFICYNDDVIEHGDYGEGTETVSDPAAEVVEDEELNVADVYASMTEDQKVVTMFIASALMEASKEEDEDEDEEDEEDDEEEVEQSDSEDYEEINHSENGGVNNMKANQFDTSREGTTEREYVAVADFMDTVRHGANFAQACIEHGVENITDLYEDPTAVTPAPLIINTPQGWVKSVLGGVKKVPFTKIKSLWTDLSAFEGTHRASGYPVLGEQKREEDITLLNRITEPGWIYKLQKLDRDVLYQITSFNFIQWLQEEMGMMLNQETARAILIGDGRTSSDPYKIKEDRIRPIAYDDSVWTLQESLKASATADEILDALIALRSDYMGSGNPTLFVSPQQVGQWLTAKNSLGNRLYSNVSEIAGLVRCNEIVEVPQLSVARNADGKAIKSIMVNMSDYALSLPTGASALKDTKFDLDFNKESYLLEWLVGGALITPKSAIVLSQAIATTP